MAVHDSRLVRTALAIVSTAMFSACPAAAQTAIRFTLAGPFEGPVAPYLVAEDKGYFRQQGLTVRIESAANAIEPITRVASGAFQMGVADLNLMMRWRDQNSNNTPLKAVFIVYNRAPYAVIARRSRGLTVPKDLEGKRVGTPANSASAVQWPLFAKLAGIDTSKVKVEPVGIPVRDPMLAAGQIDAITAYAYRSYVDLKDRGVPENDLLVWRMAEFGLLGYSNAIVVNDKFAADNPKAVAGFLSAFLRGLKDSVANPAAAVASVIQRNEVAKRDVELERLRMALRENVLTDEVRRNGYGEVDTSRLEAAIEQQALAFKFKSRPTPAQVFDGSFLPPAAERKVN
jgi:NitT/TauT family transport system substrate-binding protein